MSNSSSNQLPTCDIKITQSQLSPTVLQYQLWKSNDTPLTVSEFVSALKDSQHCRKHFNQVFTDCPYPAYFFESKAVRKSAVEHQQYEFVLVKADFEGLNASIKPFYEHLKDSQPHEVRNFFNLGKDAMLVSPCKDNDKDPQVYCHLGNFVRGADEEQVDNLWKLVAQQYEDRINAVSDKPIWLSTSGLGVYWLHVRICVSPKYYSYGPYKVDM